MNYEFKTKPFPHQLSEFEAHFSDRARGLLWEMGTGKTKETIDQAAALYEEGAIDCLLIVAPDGVHLNWITDEIPAHLPNRINAMCFAYRNDKASTVWHRQACNAVMEHKGLLVVAMSYDATMSDALMERDPHTGRRSTVWKGGKRFMWDLLADRKCMFVADESRRIKNPKAIRTKVILKASVSAPYRRILNGTPVPNGPFDIYSQLKFLDENFWVPHGISTFTAFKTMFGEFQKGAIRDANGKLREFDQLVGYKNLDMLQRIVKTICSRVTKDDVLSLPPKIYSRRVFEMTAAQTKLYNQLRDDYMAYLDSGELITAPLAITRLIRFQQVTSGFIPVEGDEIEPIRDIGSVNPRMDLLKEIAEDIPHKAIYWCKFNRTVDLTMEVLGKLNKKVVRYDGQVSPSQREHNKNLFQKGDADAFVAKQGTAGEGLTLHAARDCIYIENTYDLAARLQSEDRAHRIGQEFSVGYTDLAALGSVDENIVAALQKKFGVAQEITGDRIKEWLLSSTN